MMRFAFTAAILFAISLVPVYGQGPCPGGRCPTTQGWSGGYQYAMPQQPQYVIQPASPMVPVVQPQQPQQPTGPAAVVKVRSIASSNVTDCTTGAIIESDGTTASVLTTAHGITYPFGTVDVLAAGRQYPAEIAAYDGTVDLALLRIQAPAGITPLQVSSEDHVIVGRQVTVPGYTAGAVRGYARRITSGDYDTMVFAGTVRPGGSGSPVLDGSGQVVGVVWGSVEGESHATCLRHLRNFLSRGRRGRATSGITVQAEAVIVPPKPTQQVPQTVPGPCKPPAETPLPVPQNVPSAVPQTVPGPPGVPGRDGVDGKPGPQGPPDEKAMAAVAQLAKALQMEVEERKKLEVRIAAAEAKPSVTEDAVQAAIHAAIQEIPPIYMRKVDHERKTEETIPIRPGEGFTIHLYPPK